MATNMMVKLVVNNVANMALMRWWILLIISGKSNGERCGVCSAEIGIKSNIYYIIPTKFMQWLLKMIYLMHVMEYVRLLNIWHDTSTYRDKELQIKSISDQIQSARVEKAISKLYKANRRPIVVRIWLFWIKGKQSIDANYKYRKKSLWIAKYWNQN